jgi:argininosuccinate synthase
VTQTNGTTRIVFACSGSAGNLAAIPRLASAFGADVVALTLDVGQARELEGVRQAALAAGAVRAHVLDAREEFARHCITSSRDDHSPDARPLIARKLVEVALIEGATASAHGGDGDDHAAIEAAARAFGSVRVIAAGTGAADVNHGVETTLWERSPSTPDLDEPARLEIAFERGLPVAVNGVPMTLTELIESVATIAAAPAAAVFQAAHEALGAEASGATGATVCLELFKGRHRVLSARHS